jgi:arylsulfatase A-like enzyme
MGVESSAVRTAGASDMVDRALHALSEETGRPRFLYLHFMDPHDPYTPPPDLARAADPGYTGKLTFTGGTLYSILRGEQPVSDADLRHARALYDAEVAGMDREIARLLERLKPRLLEGRAIVAFTADHGEEFMDHGALGHEHTLYQELIHVPLILSFHGILEAGRVVEVPVRLMDLAPTLLDLAGLPVEPSFHGRSLLPALRGAAPQASEPIFSEEDFTGYRTTSPRMRSARMGGVKIILYQRGIFDLGPWRSEAFDLSADGGERSPLREGDAASREAEAALRVWMSRQPGARTRGTEIDPETERRLRALGYIQ